MSHALGLLKKEIVSCKGVFSGLKIVSCVCSSSEISDMCAVLLRREQSFCDVFAKEAYQFISSHHQLATKCCHPEVWLQKQAQGGA